MMLTVTFRRHTQASIQRRGATEFMISSPMSSPISCIPFLKEQAKQSSGFTAALERVPDKPARRDLRGIASSPAAA